MEFTDVYVKENFGCRKTKVRIIIQDPIPVQIRTIISEMPLDQVRAYGKARKWNVITIND